jgi:hypothetical protein
MKCFLDGRTVATAGDKNNVKTFGGMESTVPVALPVSPLQVTDRSLKFGP